MEPPIWSSASGFVCGSSHKQLLGYGRPLFDFKILTKCICISGGEDPDVAKEPDDKVMSFLRLHFSIIDNSHCLFMFNVIETAKVHRNFKEIYHIERIIVSLKILNYCIVERDLY